MPEEAYQPCLLGSAAASKMGWYLLPARPPLSPPPHGADYPPHARALACPSFLLVPTLPPPCRAAERACFLFSSLPVGEPAGGRARVCSELIVIIS